jgi:LysR family transcriptional regulator (chromosome initiation inhibitor)
MLDAEQLAALAAVIHEGSFERAAGTLHVTRSAISQRVKALEERLGHVLVRRGSPCTATAIGERVFRHARQLALTESELLEALPGDPLSREGAAGGVRAPPRTVSLAVNADSLATWFIAALAPFAEGGRLAFDLHVEDQDHSADLLRQGRVMGAVTADPKPVQGCAVVPLGAMRYRAVASPAFRRRWFPAGLTPDALAAAPMLVFDRQDALQHRFVRRYTRRRLAPPVHWIPSSQGFVEAASVGLGWGMNPESMVREGIAAGRLVDLAPKEPQDVALYWQHWRLEVAMLASLTAAVREAARHGLRGK